MEASELFDICAELAESQPSAEGTRRMHEVLTLVCAEGTRHSKGAFGNLFAQVDHLCRKHGMSEGDRMAVQDMRRHSNQWQPLKPDDWRYDLRALSLFVSAVLSTAIPEALLLLLPAVGRPTTPTLRMDRRCVRCLVNSWNEQTISVETDDGPMTVDYGSADDVRSLGYLQKVLRQGMQLNLLDCQVEGRTITPLLVVAEPDFLVDISSLAACFTAYGHHPLLYTVNRLKPRPNTQAILLGNFAGTVLDDIIYSPHFTLASSLTRSFREQAMRFCTCQDFSAERFKRDAQMQADNIRSAVAAMQDGAQRNFLLEPSFVCERLGLQGRVDLMTTDMRLLVEQKSGKNMKIERQSHDSHGWQREDHYVQLLLYYGVLRYNFGLTDRSADMRLLYSRYMPEQGLLKVNFYRALFREAIQLRNQIVATELLMAREGFGRILPLLAPAYIYNKVKPDAYFARYVLPELQQLQQLLASLPPAERAYLERMATFVYREQLYQKLGSAGNRLLHSGGADSDLWQMPLAEKLQSGNIVMNLSIEKLQKTDQQGGYDLITLCGKTDNLNFRRGDMVYLYAYREQPDVRQSILFKGTLERISSGTLAVRLNNAQQNATIFNQPRWAVEHGGSDLMTSTALRLLLQWAAARPERRQLLLGLRTPEADTSLQLSRSYSPAYDEVLLRVKQSRHYFLLVGPPGTGKTSQALRFMVQEALPEGPLLLMAYTNRAVDEICDMLEGEGWDYLRLGNASAADPRFRQHLLEEQLHGAVRLDDIRQRLERTPIVVGTTSTVASRQEIFSLKHFALCIIDEASQILEPNIIGLLSSDRIDRFVLIGDYKQLPAVVQQSEAEARVNEPLLRRQGLTDCRQSLFERLFRWERQQGRTQFVGTLNHQGRMHPDVALFPSTHFYAAEHLQPVPLSHQLESGPLYATASQDRLDQLLQHHRVLYLDETQPPLSSADITTMWQQLLGRLHRLAPDQSIGVIVTYRNQIAPIRQAAEQLGADMAESISIDTVERYQGSQRDIIIYHFGMDHLYQLDFLTASTFVEEGHLIDRKLNVVMTRARRQLIMIGRASILQHVPMLRELIAQYQADDETK